MRGRADDRLEEAVSSHRNVAQKEDQHVKVANRVSNALGAVGAETLLRVKLQLVEFQEGDRP